VLRNNSWRSNKAWPTCLQSQGTRHRRRKEKGRRRGRRSKTKSLFPTAHWHRSFCFPSRWIIGTLPPIKPHTVDEAQRKAAAEA